MASPVVGEEVTQYWRADDGIGTVMLVNADEAIFTARSGRVVRFVPWPPDVGWHGCA
ncbi:MAG: hypothetical protein HY681_04615 [Chloroflexi bacterium]|nr:hypothetical protein [Chloroflexota bacterium]